MIFLKRYWDLITKEAVYPLLLSTSKLSASRLYTRRLRRLRRPLSASFRRTYLETFNLSDI